MPLEFSAFLTSHGRFSFLRWLGRGSVCTVAELLDTKIGIIRAGKVLRSEHRNSSEARDRLRQEGRLLARVPHPHVIGVYDILDSDVVGPVLVMELAAGPLPLSSEPLPLDEGLKIAKQMLDGLEAIHDAGILHRDVKPQNLLLMRDRRVVLSDLGVGKGGPPREHATQAGEALGTAAYSAPEQLQDSSTVDVTADVYGAGATMYRLLTGKPPIALWRAELEGTPLLDLPEPIRPWVSRAIRMHPKRRFQSIHEMTAALAEVRIPTRSPEPES